MQGQRVFLKCEISMGGFSGERVFELSTMAGSNYAGIAPVAYCRRNDGSPYNLHEPSAGEQGQVMARLIKNGGNGAFVAIPDGEAISVPGNIVVEA